MNSLGGRIGNGQLVQHLVRQLQTARIINGATNSTTSSNEPEIRIPFRKERNATDILFALEKTIKRDPTAAHYKYHDDPFLIPTSNAAKRSYALSKESGRKAAMWILKEHSNLFQHKIAEPEIQAFMPKAEYTNADEVSEELLMTVINQGSVTDAMTIYKLIEDKTSIECKQALLELLCFYNNQEQIPDDLIEERWYRRANSQQNQIWSTSREIDQLFDFLKQQDKPVAAAAYNALICGTAKYAQIERAWALFEECEAKKIPLNLRTYNSLILLIPWLRDGAPERKTLLVELLTKINEVGLRPNVGTLNAALKGVAKIHITHIAKDLARSLFTDFKSIGVEPSLASYYHALKIFHKDRGPRSMLLREIVDELEGKTFTMQDPDDTMFFVTAMEIARYRMEDRVVAEKLHKLLLTGDNYNFIGEGFKESIYYRHYMVLLLRTLPFEEFMQTYDLMVPHIYIPEPSVMEEIINAVSQVEASLGQQLLPRLFSQMIMFNQLDRQDLVTKTLNMMRTSCSPPADSPINKQFGDAAWNVWTYMEEQATQLHAAKISRTGQLLADIALLCLRGGEFERFLTVVSYMAKQHGSLTGVAKDEQLKEMFQACIDRGDVPASLFVLEYAVEVGFEEVVPMAKLIQSTFNLTVTQDLQLTSLVGKEALKMPSSPEKETSVKLKFDS